MLLVPVLLSQFSLITFLLSVAACYCVLCCVLLVSLCSSLLSADGSLAVCGFADSSIKLWDLYASSGETDNTRYTSADDDFPAAVQRPLLSTTVGLDHTTSPSLSSSSSLSSATPDWSRPSYARLLGHSGAVFGLSLSSDQRFLLSSSDDATIRLWHTDTARNIVAYKGHTSTVWDVAFSPLSQHFASAAQSTTQHTHTTTRDSSDRKTIQQSKPHWYYSASYSLSCWSAAVAAGLCCVCCAVLVVCWIARSMD